MYWFLSTRRDNTTSVLATKKNRNKHSKMLTLTRIANHLKAQRQLVCHNILSKVQEEKYVSLQGGQS